MSRIVKIRHEASLWFAEMSGSRRQTKYINWVAYANKQLAQRDAIHVLTPTGRVTIVCAPQNEAH